MMLVLSQLVDLLPEPAGFWAVVLGIVILGGIAGMTWILWRTSKQFPLWANIIFLMVVIGLIAAIVWPS